MAKNEGWNPGPKYQHYLLKIQDILGEERRTVRDVYYALEARGFPAELASMGWDFEYRYVKRAVKKGRRHGYIDPDLIIDTSRLPENTTDPGHGTPRRFLKKHVETVYRAYRENFWDDQPNYVEVWLEKRSLVSVFQPIVERHNVRLEATGGDWSDSKVYEATQRLRGKMHDGKDVKILYFGDFNPSGLHAPVAVQRTMGHYGLNIPRNHDVESQYFDIWPFSGPLDGVGDGSLIFERLSLVLDEIDEFDLPENPTPSNTDKDETLRQRFMRYASGGRDVNIELNALKEFEREYLEDRLESAIEQYIDDDIREETEERVRERKDQLKEAISVDYDAVDG